MNYKSKHSLTNINEMYAIGPAISILMEGYIDRNKLTSLRGTLVPATTINKTISKIPLLGKSESKQNAKRLIMFQSS